jgi:hypothetical protein
MYQMLKCIDKHQRNPCSLAPTSAPLTMWGISYFWLPRLGLLPLYGRSLHSVSRSGLLWSTSVSCDDTQQVVLLGTVSRCWCKLTLVTSQGELISWTWFPCSAELFHVLVFWLLLASRLVTSLRRSQRYADLSPASTCDHDSSFLQDEYSLNIQIYWGFAQIFMFAQMFVLGPRLILSVREYNAKLVADFDTATPMTSIAFQDYVHASTSSSVSHVIWRVLVCRMREFVWTYFKFHPGTW